MVEMFGIPHCDTIKKARSWLQQHGIDYQFHNYKSEGLDQDRLTAWVEQVGWQVLLNKRGTTWRKLDDARKEQLDAERAIGLMCENPSMVKRPVLIVDGHIEVGFSEQAYRELLA